MKNCIQIHGEDNVATVLAHVEAGDTLAILNAQMNGIGFIRATQHIPYAHKIGLTAIGKGESLIKFGERIGRATRTIEKGEYVHVHNVVSVEGTPSAQKTDEVEEIR